METLGIDLASDPRKTGVCVVDWGVGEAVVEELWVGADDDELLSVYERAEVTGIDAPFGWPESFVKFMGGDEQQPGIPWGPEKRDELRFRLTDHRVREIIGRWPLSVSTDLIGVPALRCAGILERMGVTDRSGDGRVYETYPAAALHVWGLKATGYKGPKKRKEREALWAALRRKIPWLRFSSQSQETLIVERDDALDALVAALVTRAAVKGFTTPPSEEQCSRARSEGWIHVPAEDSLSQLL